MKAQTMALTAMVLFQDFHAGNARSELDSGFHISLIYNRFLFLAVGAALGLHVLSLYLPPMQFVLRVEPIKLETWGPIVLTALSVVVVVELHKWIRRRYPLRSQAATVVSPGTQAVQPGGRTAVR